MVCTRNWPLTQLLSLSNCAHGARDRSRLLEVGMEEGYDASRRCHCDISSTTSTWSATTTTSATSCCCHSVPALLQLRAANAASAAHTCSQLFELPYRATAVVAVRCIPAGWITPGTNAAYFGLVATSPTRWISNCKFRGCWSAAWSTVGSES